MLTENEITRIAIKVVELLRRYDDEMVTTEEAAKLLGVSPGTVRRNKDKYHHTKTGDGRSARLLFKKSSLNK